MSIWSPLRFTKYKGMSLPEVIFIDPNWFFWAYEKSIFNPDLNSMLAYEAELLFKKATHIKPRIIGVGKPEVEYFVDQWTGKFSHFKIVEESKPAEFGNDPIFTKYVIDWSVPRNLNFYDRAGGELIVRQTKMIFFGFDINMSGSRAEDFFDNDRRFDIPGVSWNRQF